MTVFVDTSAFLAILNAADECHQTAAKAWEGFVRDGTELVTSNYVLVETTALLQRRHGLPGVRAFADGLMTVVRTEWITPEQHQIALAGVMAGGRHGPSLVDGTSFALIRMLDIPSVLAFDEHFTERGYCLCGEAK